MLGRKKKSMYAKFGSLINILVAATKIRRFGDKPPFLGEISFFTAGDPEEFFSDSFSQGCLEWTETVYHWFLDNFELWGRRYKKSPFWQNGRLGGIACTTAGRYMYVQAKHGMIV